MADPLARLLDSEEFRRFLSGRETTADEAELGRLAARAGVEVAALAGLREAVGKGELWRHVARKTGLDPELIWRRPARPMVKVVVHAPAATTQRRRRWVPRWAGLAAAVAALVAAGGTLAQHRRAQERRVTMHVVATQAGQRIQYRLPDGSRVVLAPETELRYSGWTATGSRELVLVGEAYFDVVHDERRPFRVRVGNAIVENLGTEFVVRDYLEDESGHVAVRSGLVAVHPRVAVPGSDTKLAPGDVARIGADGAAVKVAADTGALFGWTEGQLAFRDAPVSAVLRQLQRWYGHRVVATDSALLATQVTFVVAERNTPAEAVAYLAALAGARVERRGDDFVLRR